MKKSSIVVLYYCSDSYKSRPEATVLVQAWAGYARPEAYERRYRTGPPEPVFLNFYEAQESIPRNEFRQPM